ncbi:hypothetical protein BJ742DRAFT_679974, partial [Cladochytrium replicatum]
PLDRASRNGQVVVLDWWRSTGHELTNSESAMDWTSKQGHEDVLDWWILSGLDVRWRASAMTVASRAAMLEWWMRSGLAMESKPVSDRQSAAKNEFADAVD